MSARKKALAIFTVLVLSLGFLGARVDHGAVSTSTSAHLVFLAGYALSNPPAEETGGVGAAIGAVVDGVAYLGGEFGWLAEATAAALGGAATVTVGVAA
jgi:hypothetical protein